MTAAASHRTSVWDAGRRGIRTYASCEDCGWHGNYPTRGTAITAAHVHRGTAGTDAHAPETGLDARQTPERAVWTARQQSETPEAADGRQEASA
jgi:hypothetical protein